MRNEPVSLYNLNGIPAYGLKVGDLFSTDHGFGLITRITSRKYYYQVVGGKEKSSAQYGLYRKDFWNMADDSAKFNNLVVHYSPETKYRRKRKIEM